MKARIKFDRGKLRFTFSRDEYDEDQLQALRFTMTDEEIFFDLGQMESEPHPDLLGLATIFLCNPFVGEELHLPRPVSKRFMEMASSVISRYKIASEVDENIVPISSENRTKPGLAFSGGADSSAALAVMPSSTVPIFLNRPIAQDSVYDSHAPLKICEILSQSGYDVQIVTSNLEYLRDPIGFPTDLANSIPAILISSDLGLDSISFGTIMESGYGIGHEHYVDYSKGAHWRFYNTLFQSVGLSLSLPVLGVSEVGTAIICNSAPVALIAQSCIRGGFGRPCMRCWKCFRKELLSYSIGHSESPEFQKLLSSNEVQVRLSAFPISHENVIVFSLQRINLELHPYLKPIADKLDMELDLEFLNRWNNESIEHVPRKYRFEIRSKILEYMEPMHFEDFGLMKSWDMSPHLSSGKAKRGQEKLTSYWQDLSEKFD